MIHVENLSKTFHVHRKEPGLRASVRSLFRRERVEKQAVRSVSLDVAEGEIVGLVGPNGAGKTTLVKMLAGIIHPTAGTAQVLGHEPWKRDDDFRRQIALIMGQKAQLWWDLPAADSFLLLREIYRIPEAQYRETLDTLSEMLAVKDELTVQLRRLSLGERMKMELIAALLHRPRVVFLDEPTIGLDLTAQRAIRDFLLTYRETHRPAMILTSHYMEDIERLCKRIVIIRDGEFIFDGPLQQVMDRYVTNKTVEAQYRGHAPDGVASDLAPFGRIEHLGRGSGTHVRATRRSGSSFCGTPAGVRYGRSGHPRRRPRNRHRAHLPGSRTPGMTPRLFLHIVSMEARRRMSYRADFWISATVGVLASFGLAWFLWRAMFASAGVDTIAGFSFEAMLLYYVVVILIAKIVRGYALDMQVSADIYEGGLTRYLVFPAGYFAFKYAQHVGTLAPIVIQSVVFGAVFGLVIGVPADAEISVARTLATVAILFAGNLLYFQMNLPLQSVSFWADNVWSLSVALRMASNLFGGMLVPIALFPAWARDALAWTPFPLLFDAPARMFIGKMGVAELGFRLGVALCWMVALALITAWVWRRGRLRYTGVGI